MAAPRLTLRFWIAAVALAIVSPATLSLNCSSPAFEMKVAYQNCSELRHLGAVLRWTYAAANSSLSVAFEAVPVNASSWIAYGVNLNGTGMVGTEALIAFRSDRGAMVVKPYKLRAYDKVVQENLSIETTGLGAEVSDGGVMRITATLLLPAAAKINQVWQRGPVLDGEPAKHEMQTENLNAKGTLELVKIAKNGTAPSPSSSGGVWIGEKSGLGVLLVLALVGNFMVLLSLSG